MSEQTQESPTSIEAPSLKGETQSTDLGNIEAEVKAESNLNSPIPGEDVAELHQEVTEAVEAGASDAEIQSLVEKFKIKVNGQEKEVELDWNNKEDIVRRLQLAESGQSAMQKSAELEKAFTANMQKLQENPWELLEELGLDADELAEARIQARIAELSKTPEELERDARDAELEQLRQQIKAQKEKEAEIEQAQLLKQAEIEIDKEITEALSATTSLPKSTYVVKRIADVMTSAIQNGYHDVTAADAVPIVERQMNEELQELFDSMPAEALEQFMGKSAIDKLRESRLKQIPTQATKVLDTGKSSNNTEKEKKKINMNDWLKGRASLK